MVEIRSLVTQVFEKFHEIPIIRLESSSFILHHRWMVCAAVVMKKKQPVVSLVQLESI